MWGRVYVYRVHIHIHTCVFCELSLFVKGYASTPLLYAAIRTVPFHTPNTSSNHSLCILSHTAGGNSPLFEQLVDGVEQRWKVLEQLFHDGDRPTEAPLNNNNNSGSNNNNGSNNSSINNSTHTPITWAYEWLLPNCAHALLMLLLAALLTPGAQHKRAAQLLQRAASLLDAPDAPHSNKSTMQCPRDAQQVVVFKVLVQQAHVSLLLCTSRVAQAQAMLVDLLRMVEVEGTEKGGEGLGMLKPGLHMLCGMGGNGYGW